MLGRTRAIRSRCGESLVRPEPVSVENVCAETVASRSVGSDLISARAVPDSLLSSTEISVSRRTLHPYPRRDEEHCGIQSHLLIASASVLRNFLAWQDRHSYHRDREQ